MADRLLDQRAQPRLHPVERPLLVGEPILGPPVPDRGYVQAGLLSREINALWVPTPL